MASKPENNHISQQPFGNILAQFVGGDTDSLGMASSPTMTPAAKANSRKKRKSEFEFDDLPSLDTGLNLDDIDEIDDSDEYDENFDLLIETAFQEDEDITLRNSLVAMGRKYAIKSMDEAESSEVHRSFIEHEQGYRRLLENVDVEIGNTGRDLDRLRQSRTTNYKALADLVSARGSLLSTQRAIIKDMVDLKKSEYDITMKLKKEAAAANGAGGEDGGIGSAMAIQRILSVGRKNLIGDDAYDYPDQPEDDGSNSTLRPGPVVDESTTATTILHDMEDVPEAVTDGDKFIEYEDRGVDYVVDYDDDDNRKIYAVDSDGVVVPDYPMPSNPEQLTFSLNELAGTATDQLQRSYKLYRNGQPVNRNRNSDDGDDGFF